MDRTRNALLFAGATLPLALLLWPFAGWGAGMSLALRVISALCAQALACRAGSRPLTRALPLLAAGLLAGWGVCLYLTSPHWAQATLGDLLADYVSPFLACVLVYAAAEIRRE